MRRYLPFLLVLFVGLTSRFGFSAPAAPWPSGGPAAAHDDRDERRHDEDRRFNDHDREYARDYYRHHRGEFRYREHWGPDYEARMHEGYVIEPEMRGWVRPAPYGLVRSFGPPPPGYRYVMVGGHVVLIDRDYRIHDTIHLELGLGH